MWMLGYNGFLNKACAWLGIWRPPPGMPPAMDPPHGLAVELAHAQSATFDSVPDLPESPLDLQWDGFRNRVWIQPDCKSACDITNGEAVLKGAELEYPYRRIAQKLYELSVSGWQGKRDIDNLVIWLPRRFNIVADHLANAALDQGPDLHRQLAARSNPDACLRVCLDGALRGNIGAPSRPAAMGCAIYEVRYCSTSAKPVHVPVLYAAQRLSCIRSAFEAETLALEWSLSLVDSLC